VKAVRGDGRPAAGVDIAEMGDLQGRTCWHARSPRWQARQVLEIARRCR
jgi:hypothetical protein